MPYGSQYWNLIWRMLAKISLNVLLVGLLFLLSCNSAEEKPEYIEPVSWDLLIRDVGTFSSPRAIDLSNDGIKDIVMGAGKVEFQYTDSAVVALNGADGSLLWLVPARDQMFGSPAFLDVTNDEVPDVFIGGRSAEFMAIDGRSGEIIWEYFHQGDEVDFAEYKVYNFYNPQFTDDIDGDGYRDIIVANGGYVRALPDDPNRPPGKLMIISSKSGKLIAEAYLPDGKETYMSAVVTDVWGTEKVIFGSGGERIAGNLYIAEVEDVLKGDLSNAKKLDDGRSKGFIAPPVVVDVNKDGIPDIVASAVEGRMMAIDGKSHNKIWELRIPGTEAYSSIAVGFFNQDSVPDLFTNFGIGIFPNIFRSYQLAIDGANGNLIRQDSLGSFHYGSPVAYDLNGDGVDEGIFHINHLIYGMVKNDLKVFDFAHDTLYSLVKVSDGANVASTPLLDDLDRDGFLEVVYTNENNPNDLLSIGRKTGLFVHVLKTDVPVSKPILWGTYMGSGSNGVFIQKKD